MPVSNWSAGLAVALVEAVSDIELAFQAQRGDVAAFEELYRTHCSRIYALCLRMVADRSRAEDLTQEAFVRAWEKLASFRGESAFLSWLYRLAVNVVLSDVRSRRRREGDVAGLEESRLPDPRAVPHRVGACIDLERAIESLPPQARMVFVLHDVQGYRHREIAGLMGLAVGTSKAQLHHARRRLREALRK